MLMLGLRQSVAQVELVDSGAPPVSFRHDPCVGAQNVSDWVKTGD